MAAPDTESQVIARLAKSFAEDCNELICGEQEMAATNSPAMEIFEQALGTSTHPIFREIYDAMLELQAQNKNLADRVAELERHNAPLEVSHPDPTLKYDPDQDANRESTL